MWIYVLPVFKNVFLDEYAGIIGCFAYSAIALMVIFVANHIIYVYETTD